MNNLQKFEIFIEIEKVLNQELGSVPILYGSLGLAKSIGRDLQINDIDFLIEENVFSDSLEEVRNVMQWVSIS